MGSIDGTIQLPNEGNQEAAKANLATIPVQTAINTAVSSQGGTVLRAELQNEDGFLVYNVEIVVPGDKRVHEVKGMLAVPARSCELMSFAEHSPKRVLRSTSAGMDLITVPALTQSSWT